MRRLIRGAGLVVGLLLTLACGERSAFGQEYLSDEEGGRVDTAIRILEKKAEFLATEKGADPAFVKRFGLSVKALRRVFDKQEGRQDHGYVLKGGLPPGVPGMQPGPGQELDANGKPVPEKDKAVKGAGRNRIQLDKQIVSAEATDCSALFLRLVSTLLHEATHLNQVHAPYFPTDEGELKDAVKTPADATNLLNAKLKQKENEIEAHGDEAKLLAQMMSALNDIDLNPATTPSWAVHWKDCPHLDLATLLAFARVAQGDHSGIVHGLQKVDVEVQTQQKNGIPNGEIVLNVDRNKAFKHVVTPDTKDFIGLEYQDSRLLIENIDGGVAFLETAIPHPEDVMLVQAKDGTLKLLVCGVSDFDHPHGIIRVFDLPSKLPTLSEISGVATLALGTVPYVTVAAANPFLVQPTSLVQTPDGSTYVWDVGASALYPITSSHGNGIPDHVNLSRSLVQIPPAFDLSHLTTLVPVNGGLVLGWRVGVAVDSGDPLVFEFRDQDRQGFFRTVRPTRLSRLLDAIPANGH